MKIAQNSYAITGLPATPPWVVNVGMVIGDKQTLIIDTGMNTLSAQTIYGYATVLSSTNQLMALNCEPHFDHIGGNSYFASQGVDIYGHPDIKRTEADFKAEKAEYNQTILNAVRKESQEAEVFFLNTVLCNPKKAISGGDSLDLGSLTVEVVATPGHTPLNLSVYNPTDGVLFCADCIVTGYIPNLEAGDPALWKQWHDSLDTIEQIDPGIVVPGHGPVLEGPDISTAIEQLRRVLDEAIETGIAPTRR